MLVRDQGGDIMRMLYDGMSFEVIREAAAFNNGIFSTNYSTEQVTAGNSSTVRDGGRYRWIGEDTTTNDRYRYIGNGGETNLKPRYTGIQVTLYGRGEPVAMNRTVLMVAEELRTWGRTFLAVSAVLQTRTDS